MMTSLRRLEPPDGAGAGCELSGSKSTVLWGIVSSSFGVVGSEFTGRIIP